MPTQVELKFIEEQVNKLKGCTVKDLIVERKGKDSVVLKRIVLVSEAGDEFQVLPFNWEELHIEQTRW